MREWANAFTRAVGYAAPVDAAGSCSSRKEMRKYGIFHPSMELGNTVCAVLVDARVVSGGYDISVYDEVGNWTLVQAPGSIYEKCECTYRMNGGGAAGLSSWRIGMSTQANSPPIEKLSESLVIRQRAQ